MNREPLTMQFVPSKHFLPGGKTCAVCLTVDDVHPGTSRDAYEAGGDLGRGALQHIAWLLERHPQLKVTLFVTPDWRQISPFPMRKWLARTPFAEHAWLAPVLPKATMRLDRHRAFCDYLRSLPRTDLALHGLHHVQRGPRIGAEFAGRSRHDCATALHEAKRIFSDAHLPLAPGIQPPLWEFPAELAQACVDVGLQWVMGARDVKMPPTHDATTQMSGPHGMSLTRPTLIADGQLVHFTTNFQATNTVDHAFAILDDGGILAIKAHVVKRVGHYVALDGLDEAYRAYLDALLRLIQARYGERVYYAPPGELASRVWAALRTTQRAGYGAPARKDERAESYNPSGTVRSPSKTTVRPE